ncbi:MAG: selenocysteine-specific translation elongation factor [Proteobacteria bacterium]|nr:selenocysteine-specific translation elongation factor [Pseudomonadota bacterium]MBU1594424.1 selenocysteine-specific translation elongation factor [Pseudomonadota bacterium]
MPVIMGTAGHIDHGKTTLVKALTGIDCDRLAEEKKRGITIELGFAFMDLPPGKSGPRRLGVVDVPGHERFVKNMVAGAAGIDFVVLVIAADEGIMPQTREHLEICSLLGIQTGVVALTKVDMVEPDWLMMVQEEVAGYLKGTFLDGAACIPVSAHTGQGLDALKAELARLAEAFQPHRRSDLFRLPVDRVFTMKGYGTVVTGTLVSGKIRVGEDVAVYPSGLSSKVRTLQSHGAQVEEVASGSRTAVNLSGLEVEDLARGDVLARPGSLFPSPFWDVELTCLKSSPRPIKHRKEVHFHHGAREVLARVYMLEGESLEPGQTAICRIRFAEPLAGVHGDRVVARSFSPLRTIAGGRLLSPLPHRVKRFSPAVETLRSLGSGSGEEIVQAQLELAGAGGLTFAQLLVASSMESKALDKALQLMGGRQEAFLTDREARSYVSGAVVQSLSEGLLAHLADFHAREPMKPGVARGGLSSTWGRRLSPKLFHFVLEGLLRKGSIASDQEMLRLPGHRVSLASDAASLRQKLLEAYTAGGLTPPNMKDVLEPLSLTFKEAAAVFKVLQDEGRLVKIKEEMYFDAAAVLGLQEKVVAFFASHEDMNPQDFREVSALSRKYAIPLLEYFDKEKLTVRVGDNRKLRKR